MSTFKKARIATTMERLPNDLLPSEAIAQIHEKLNAEYCHEKKVKPGENIPLEVIISARIQAHETYLDMCHTPPAIVSLS